MTLLISAFTKKHAFLASDRRLGFINNNGKVVSGNDDACKLIYFDGRYLVGYTGFANLGSSKDSTDTWIAKTLQYREDQWDTLKAIRHMAIELKAELSKIKHERAQLFTALFTGWDYFKDSDELQPAFGHISTYLTCVDKNLVRVPFTKKDGRPVVMYSLRRLYKNEIPFVFTAGQEVDRKRFIGLNRRLRKYSEKNVSQNLIIDTLYNEIINASTDSTGKDWIGKGVLAAAISSESAGKDSFFTLGDSGSGQQFRYYPSNGIKHIFKGPHAVIPGGTVLINFKVGYLNDSDQVNDIWSIPWTKVQ